MNHPPQISVGMPVYNGEAFLEAAIESILAQTFKDFELIISDNGSSDGTAEICRRYAKSDRRIRYYRREENAGAGWNFNRVFELATAPYFRWACHDDLCHPQLLERCARVLDRQQDVILAYPQTTIIDERDRPIEDYDDGFSLPQALPHQRFERYFQLIRHGHGCHPLYGLIRTDILRRVTPLGSYPSSDLVLLGQLTLNGQFYEVPARLFLKRDHPNTSVRAHNAFRARLAWYDPSRQGTLHLTRWKWFFEYLKGISTAPMSREEKYRCYRQVGYWAGWNWLFLAKDILKAIFWPILHLILRYEWRLKAANTVQLR